MEVDELRRMLVEQLADDLVRSKSFKILQDAILDIASSSDLNLLDDQEKLIDHILRKVVGKISGLFRFLNF